MCQDTYARMIIKMGSGVPTIPASTDHRNGDWIATDIYEGELYMDTTSGIIYTSLGGVIQTAVYGSTNFANANLTFDANRTHDTNGFIYQLTTDTGAFAEGWYYMDSTTNQIGFNDSGLNIDNTGATLRGKGKDVLKATVNGLEILNSVTVPYQSTSAIYVLSDTDYLLNCTANTFTVTLPTAVGIDGRQYIIKNSGSGVITLEGDGTETIDGALNQTLNQYDAITVVSDGTNWIII